MTSPRAAIYVRISDDPSGQRAGVERQLADCLALAERHGWTVVEVYEDNDKSAYSGKPRPRFERLLADAAANTFDVVVAWASDRLYRLMKDLVRIADELAPRARIVTVMGGGDVDLTTAEGILRAQVMGSVGEFESRRKSERIVARVKQRVGVEGRMTASRRPFGWRWADPCPGGPLCEHDRTCTPGERPRRGARAGLVVDEVEAPAVLEVMELVAGGGTVRETARLLNARGHTGKTGRPFGAQTAREVLTNPRHAGLVGHKGKVVGDAADGQRIVPVELWQRVQSRLSDPSRRTTPGRPAGTALSGIARCGKCGGPMNASNKHSKGGYVAAVYVCARHQHLTRRRVLVDDPVLALIGEWLAINADAITAHAAPAAGRKQQAAAADVERLTERLAALHELVASGDLDPADYAEAARAVRSRLRDAQARAVVASGRPATARLLGEGDVRAAWQALLDGEDVSPLRALLTEVLTAVHVDPAATPGHPAVSDLRVEWADWASGEAAA